MMPDSLIPREAIEAARERLHDLNLVPSWESDRIAWEAINSALPFLLLGVLDDPEAIKAGAEAMEDAAVRLLGRDLGTIHRNDIALEVLRAALGVGEDDAK